MDNVFSNFVGIDVSKDKVDVFSSETSMHFEVANNEKSLKAAFKKFDLSKTLVVLENTGGYERHCLNVLTDLGITIHRTNNNMVKNFIRSLGKKAKTDAIDARALSVYGRERHVDLKAYEKPSELQELIRQLAMYVYSLKTDRVKEKNRIKSPGCDQIIEMIRKTIELMDDNILDLEKYLFKLIDSDKEFKEKVELMCEYKGVGKNTAVQLLAHMPEIGEITRTAVAALSGVAPYARDSGKKSGYRTTKGGGRPIVKRTLFLAALSATRFNDSISNYYSKKQAEGKKKMVAITACMRKMVVQLNAIVRDGEIILRT